MKFPLLFRFALLLAWLGLVHEGLGQATNWAAESRNIQLLLNGSNDAATRRSRQLLRRAQQAGPVRAQAEGYWLLGCALRNQSRFDSSLYCGQQALRLAQQLADTRAQSDAYTLLAQVYKRLADAQHVALLTRKALALAGQAVSAAQAGPHPQALSRAWLVQGIIYRDLEQYDSARRCYQRAIALAERYPDRPSLLPVSYANYGQLLMDADKDYPAAIAYFRRALPLYRREGNRNGMEHAYRQLSWTYRQQGRPALAVAAADTCLTLGRASGDPHRLNNSLQAAYLAYRAAGKLPRALDLLEEWKKNTDDLANADIARAVASAQASYELEQQQARIERLAEANARQRQVLLALSGGAALLLALLGLAVWQYRVIRLTNSRLATASATLGERNFQLGQQSERLATLLREVHHRVKNNLAVVASLLRLQANRLTDADTVRVVRESQQRVEAMSLVHQSLYQTDDVTAVDLPRYVADLVQTLRQAYGFDESDLDLTLDIVPLRLDLDMATPLGLVLNELLTNAFKHGLRPQPQGSRPALRVAFGAHPAGGMLLEVADNGPGFDPGQVRRKGSFGQRLITALAGQLSGEISLETEHGTCYQLRIPSTAEVPELV